MDNLITKSHFNYKLSLFNIHTRHRNKVKWRKEFLQQRLSRQLSHESSFVSTTSAKVVILATATSRSSTTDKVDTGRSGRPTLLLPSEKSVIECSFPYSKPPVGGTISYRMKRVLHARNNCNCTSLFLPSRGLSSRHVSVLLPALKLGRHAWNCSNNSEEENWHHPHDPFGHRPPS